MLGKSVLGAGILLGLLLIAILFTDGFGLWSRSVVTAPDVPLLVKRGDTVQIPEGSPLRDRIGVIPAPVELIAAKLVLPGTVEADPARTASVLTPLAGRLLDLNVALGDRVEEGQVLAVIDSPDLAQAYDDNDKAADTLDLAGKSLRRQEEQFKLGTASTRDLDQARSDHAQAEAEFTRTQARLKAIGGLPGPTRATRYLTVRAPISGSITTLSVAPGIMINDPTQPMMTIADLSVIWVTAQVAEKDVASVTKDQTAKVSLEAYPDKVLEGKLLFISDVVEPNSHRNKVRIAFGNPDHLLKPNMFATVTLSGGAQSRVVVPTAALLMNNDRTTVFVETAPWTFERRVVEPQLEEGPSVAIRVGLNAGDKVVVKGGILLND